MVMARSGREPSTNDDEMSGSPEVESAEEFEPSRPAVIRAAGDSRQVIIGGDNTGTVDLSVHLHSPLPRARFTSSLPAMSRTFLGRDPELEQLLGDAGAERTVLIHGMAGVGKTALAVRAAHGMADRFPDGRFFVSLHTHTAGQSPPDMSTVVAGLLSTLGMDPRFIPDNLDGRLQMWRDRMAASRAVVVLDDAGDREQVEMLTPSGPGCLTLVTSRHRLRIDAKPVALQALPAGPATELFAAIARRDIGVDAERRVAARVAELCAGLPLAIGLLGARVAHHPGWAVTDVADLIEEFGEETDRIAVLDDDDPVVRAAFQLSYHRLSAQRRIMFRRLGLHPGAEFEVWAVAELWGTNRAEARRGLEALFARHLLDEIEPGRYRLHDLLRVYAVGLAARNPETGDGAALDRLLDFYEHTAKSADRRLNMFLRRGMSHGGEGASDVGGPRFDDDVAAWGWLRRERSNLLACLRRVTDIDSARTITLTNALAALFVVDGPFPLAARLLCRAEAMAVRDGDRLAEADLALALCELHVHLGDYEAATQFAHRALDRYGALEERTGYAAALGALASTSQLIGRHDRADELFRQALDVFGELGDPVGEAAILTLLGMRHKILGEHERALHCFERALATIPEPKSGFWSALGLSSMGLLRRLRGDQVAAADLFEQAAATWRAVGSRMGEATALTALGTVYVSRGESDRAALVFGTAVELFRELGNQRGEVSASLCLVNLEMHTGDHDQRDRLDRILALARAIGDHEAEATGLATLATVHMVSGELERAAEAHREALNRYRALAYPLGEAGALTGLGGVLLLLGDHGAAAEAAQQSVDIYRRLADRAGQARALTVLGNVRRESGEFDAAEEIYGRALSLSLDSGDVVAEDAVRVGIARLRVMSGDAE